MMKPASHHDVIKLLGGPSALARALGLIAVNTTLHWGSRGVPPRYQRRVSELAAARGVTIAWEDWERLPTRPLAEAA